MVRTITLAISIAALLGGCFVLPDAKAPISGAVATGEPLAVVDDVKVWTTTSKEKVAETVYKDSSGATLATADVYQDKTQVHSMKVWYPVQGTQQIPDEDFFRIAGDQNAVSALMPAGDGPVAQCKLCGKTAVGPCARCRSAVCGDCCELTAGGATSFAVCLTCVRRGGASLAPGWLGLLGWLALIVLGLAGVVVVLVLLRR